MPNEPTKEETLEQQITEYNERIEKENKQLEVAKQTYRLTPKFERWCKLFLDKSNKETFGNATRSALQAYNLDEEKQYFVASQIGKDNFIKHKNIASMYLDKQGVSHGRMVDVALAKMATTNDKRWYDEVKQLMGMPMYEEETKSSGNTQINVFNIDSEEVKDFNRDFLKFIERDKELKAQ